MLLEEAEEILKKSGYLMEATVTAKRFNTALKHECAKLLKKMDAADNNLFDDFTIIFNNDFTEMTLKCVTSEKRGGYTSVKKLGVATIYYTFNEPKVLRGVNFFCGPNWKPSNKSAWLCATQAYDPEMRKAINKWYDELEKIIIRVSAKLGQVIPEGDITVNEDITIEEGW